MTANVFHPADVERMLQARVMAAREPRTHSRTSTRARRRPQITRAFVGGLFATALLATAAWASHGDDVINLAFDNVIVEHDGAIYAQGGVGAGTGQFDPFLWLQTNNPTERGYNVCDGCEGEFETATSADHTHELRVSAVPILEFEGTLYREFSLDANDQGSDTWMSIEQVKIFVDDQNDLTDYDDATETFGGDTGTTADLIFDMDDGGDQTILLVSQGLESGSGVSDITILVPNDLFPEECTYGAPLSECDLWLTFYTAAGGFDGGDEGVDCGTKQDEDAPCDWDVSAGFEEWRVRFLPVVNIQKDATASFTRDYTWTVDKTATPTTLNLFDGDEADVTWEVTPTRDAGTDSGFTVSGTITVTNPTGDDPIPTGFDAEVLSIEDVLTIDGNDITVPASDIDCELDGDPVSIPLTLGPGESLECTYEVSTPDATSASTGVNTATVTIESAIPEGDGGIEFSDEVSYEGTADIDFSDVTPTETDATATLTDDRGPLDQAAVSGQTEDYDETFECGADEGTHDNTAVVTEDDSGDSDDSTATVTVNCYQLSVSKTVNEALTRNYTWTIDKTVTPTSIDMFDGAPEADVDWSMTPLRSAGTDSGWLVSGMITITNSAPIAATGVSVTDVIDHASLADVNATVDCSADDGIQTTVNIAASSFATCSYTATLANGDDRTNTATATLFGIGYDSAAEAIDFDGATVTETNESATVTDPLLGIDQAAASGVAILVDGGMTCPDDEGSNVNTATVTPNDGGPPDDDDATIVVNCHQLTVSKTATTTFDRNYDWDVTKERVLGDGETDGDDDLTTLVLDEGQEFTLTYEIVVSTTGSTDSNWAVAGTITITNPAPIAATGVSVTDVIDHPSLADVNATVDCSADEGIQTTVNIAASSFATCSYSAPLGNGDARTNVATATLFGVGYDSDDVPVTFDNTPDVEIDACVSVTDDNGTDADTSDDTVLDASLCISELDDDADGSATSFTFTHTIHLDGFDTCGPQVLKNTVTIVTVGDGNTGESHSDDFTVNIEVPCPTGCTLTQGYWKTHNDSFWGGAPTDETWNLIGPLAEEEIFFLSGDTYFAAMWTAPAGNAYYQLSRQYIAAVLNVLDGADAPPAVDAAIAAAEDLFETYTPAEVAAAKGKNGKELRSQFTSLASLLASFNEGLIGPGPCDEDGSSATPTSGPTLFADRRQSVTFA